MAISQLTTEEQALEACNAVETYGNNTAAAKALGISRNAIRARLATAWRVYGMQPGQPRLEIPEGRMLHKETVHYHPDGTRGQIWARQTPTQEALEDWVATLEDRVDGKRKPIKPVKKAHHDCAEILIGDPHAGMYAWAHETGSDYDLEHFARLHRDGPEYLLAQIGSATRIVLAYLGDLFHSDNEKGMTERSGNILDMDSRYGKVIDTVIESVVGTIDACAAQCQQLDVVVLRGNHDSRSAQWLKRVLAAYYRKTPHISLLDNTRNRVFLNHGNILFGYHHGDRLDANKLQMAMAQEQAELWGQTQHRYWRCGHVHHSKRYRPTWDRDEAPGVQVEYFPVLAGLEAYGAEAGHNSRRAMTAIVHDSIHGEVGRHIVTPGMLG